MAQDYMFLLGLMCVVGAARSWIQDRGRDKLSNGGLMVVAASVINTFQEIIGHCQYRVVRKLNYIPTASDVPVAAQFDASIF